MATPDEDPAAARFADRLANRLADLQDRRPWLFVLVALALSAASMPVILGFAGTDGLTLNSDFTALLPEEAQSVRDLAEIQRRFGGQQPITLTVESDDTEALHRFVRDFAPRVEGLTEHQVVAVDWNVHDFSEFVEEHRHLYADLDDLRAVHDALDARLQYERAHANPFFLDLEDEEPPDPEATIREIQREAELARGEMDERFPDGFIQHPERSLVLLVIHTRIPGGEVAQTDALLRAIQGEIDDLDPDSYAPDLEVHWGGPLMEIREETESLIAAVRDATLLTVGLVAIAIFVFFLRVRPIPLLCLVLVPPILLTFAFAELTVDYLNASSAFLSAIVVGNGINPNVMWLARYFELRRDAVPVGEALARSHRETWRGTLTASLAAGVAYGSLISTDYRGFRDFGLIGGMGMVLCWLAAYLLLPALTTISERWRPLRFGAKSKDRGGIYGVIFAKIALGSPRAVVAGSLALTVACVGLVGWAIANDPMEHDFRKLRSERPADSDVEYVIDATRAILDDTMSGSALAVLAPTDEDVPRYRAQLEAYRAEHPRAFGEIETIDRFLPADQEEKVGLLADLRRLMLEIRPHVDEELQAQIDEQLPPEELAPITAADLPDSIARPYTERDGSRGRLLFVEHHPDENSWDGRYLARWAAGPRLLRSEGASRPPPVAGTAVVFDDLMQTVWSDGPVAIGIALLATIALVLLIFQRNRDRALVIGALLVGVIWMAGTMALFGMRLNFLNFVAFPITFGIGVDYAVNVMGRYTVEIAATKDPARSVRAAIEGTGGAVILCSLTTVVGYISLHTSSNQALNSFGEAMGISEITCLAVAVLALPAGLLLLDRRRLGPRPEDARVDEV